MPLPGALLLPSPLLLPRDGLLPRTLRLLLLSGLLGTLCLLPLRLLALGLLGALLLRLLVLCGGEQIAVAHPAAFVVHSACHAAHT